MKHGYEKHGYGKGRRCRHMHMRGGHHPGRMRRRLLKHGDLRFLLLQLIGEAPRHGYDLIKAIETRTGGAYVPSPGVIYPALDVLQDMGQVRAETEDGKKVFRLTADGETALAEAGDTLAEIDARLAKLAAGEGSGNSDLRVLMRRIRHTVMTKLEAEDTRAEKSSVIVAALAEALAKIEEA